MLAILYALGTFVADLFKSRSRLEAENLFLRYQLNLALQQKPPRIRLCGSDRAVARWMRAAVPSVTRIRPVLVVFARAFLRKLGLVAGRRARSNQLIDSTYDFDLLRRRCGRGK